jgi:hypothetical protein
MGVLFDSRSHLEGFSPISNFFENSDVSKISSPVSSAPGKNSDGEITLTRTAACRLPTAYCRLFHDFSLLLRPSNTLPQKDYMKQLQMVDLLGQYEQVKEQMNKAILDVVSSSIYIGGPQVKGFQEELEQYLGVKHVIPCANGTDALQIAMMALGLQTG